MPEPSLTVDMERSVWGPSFAVGPGPVLWCGGELDLESRSQLRDAIASIPAQDEDRAVVDLSGVSFFDGCTVGVLVEARRDRRLGGGDLVVRGPSAFGLRLLTLLGLADLVAPDDALARQLEVAGLTADWLAACATGPFGAAEVVLVDPTLLVSTIVRVMANAAPTLGAADVKALLTAVGTVQTDPEITVVQLVALSTVAHAALLAKQWPPARAQAAAGALDGAVAVAITAVMDELEQAGLIDPLTGLLNRRALDRDLARFWAAAQRHDQCLTVVMIDVDGLKATNDRWGHAAGDDLLREAAAALTTRLRAGDNAYRWGGDEFVLLFCDLDPQDVQGVIDRSTSGATISFTWGCAWAHPRASPTNEPGRAGALLELADQRLVAYRGQQRRHPQGRAVDPTDEAPAIALAGQVLAGIALDVVVEQAIGILAALHHISVSDAAVALDRLAALRQQAVRGVAAGVVDGTLDLTAGPVPETDASAKGVGV